MQGAGSWWFSPRELRWTVLPLQGKCVLGSRQRHLVVMCVKVVTALCLVMVA